MNSNLQIISGKLRGKKLRVPPDARPTQNKARIALFNMLTPIIDPKSHISIWDAFAGSGAFGIECLSRWPNAKVTFTDISPESIKTIQKNLDGIPNANAVIFKTDAIQAIEKHKYGEKKDIIFIDPPYANPEFGAQFIKKLATVTKPGMIIVWEMEKDFNLPSLPENLEILKDKTYGRARFLLLTTK
ncbi:MAG: RsmD family RNA methyltransferase [Alphaproteobacteria bacterium]|nr:RsmD family RNA methyltransferase [Alphaproteobacteria bacterium]